MMQTVGEIIQLEADAIAAIPEGQSYAEIIDLLVKYIHEAGGKMVTSGMGKAGQVANNIATTMSSTGTTAVFLHPSEAQHGDLGILAEGDVLVLLSNSGMTRELIELESLAHRLYASIPVVLITGNLDGDLAMKADHVLYTGGPKEVCALGLTPTTSTTAMMVLGDVLTVLMMQRIGFSKEDYAKRHHGGYLGEKSRK